MNEIIQSVEINISYLVITANIMNSISKYVAYAKLIFFFFK